MINCNIIGKKLCPESNNIGVTGENKAEIVRFIATLDVAGIHIDGANCYACLQNRLGAVDKALLSAGTGDSDRITYDWEIDRTATQEGGRLSVYLEWQQADDVILKTYPIAFYIGGAFDVDGAMEEQYPTVLQDMEARVSRAEQMGDETAANAAKAEGHAADSAASAIQSADSATRSAASATISTEQAGKSTTGAGTAVEQAQAATQASTTATVKATEAQKSAAAAGAAAGNATAQADRAAQLVSQAESLLSQQPRQVFVATLADRDALEGLRQCDRCDVMETKSTYIYDTQDIDGNQINPEWILVSKWDALRSVSWDIITGKPEFARVATSGSFKDLLDIPDRFDAPLTLDGTGESIMWDFSRGSSAIVTLAENKPIVLQNVPPGATGVIQVYGALLQIPEGERNPLYDMLTPVDIEHMTYSFYYNGVSFDWNNLPYKGATL